MLLSESDFLTAAKVKCGSKSAGNGESSGGISRGFSELQDFVVCAFVLEGFVVEVGFFGSGDAGAAPADGF
jgi:hypothetical protein